MFRQPESPMGPGSHTTNAGCGPVQTGTTTTRVAACERGKVGVDNASAVDRLSAMDERVARLVALAPPLSRELRQRLRGLLKLARD